MTLEILHMPPKTERRPGAPPLLFVHGSYCGAWVWAEHFMPFFAGRGFDCRAVSLRGHGGSRGAGGLDRYGVADYVADVAAAASGLRAPPVVVGHSLGAWIAMKFAEAHPVAGLALLAPVPPSGLWAPLVHMWLVAPQLLWQFWRLENYGHAAADASVFHRALFADGTPLAWGMRYWPLWQRESRRVAMEMTPLNAPRRPVPAPPALVLGGDADRFIPVAALWEAAWYYGADLEQIPGLPHGLMLDPGWRKAAEPLLAWLDRRFPA